MVPGWLFDIVVVNAGVEWVRRSVLDFTEEQFELFEIDTKGAFFTVQRVARYVVDGGGIMCIGSSTMGDPWPD
jgi:3-oxoacyl-[acyl-carrier protein] reductase